MSADVDFIVDRLKGQWLSESDQRAIVERIERHLRSDTKLQDVFHGATYYLDRFLLLLKGKAYQRTAISTLFQAQHAIVFDDLWRRLQGGSLGRFQEIVLTSRGQAAGPGTTPNESAFDTVVAPVFWTAASLLSVGVVTPSLFEGMHAAAIAGSRPGGSVFMAQLGVLLRHGGQAAVDFLTFGTVRAAYEGALAYAVKYPDCSMQEIRAAGLLAAADAVLPIAELKIIAKACGLIEADKGEMPPTFWRAVQALFEAALKTIVIGAVIKAKVEQGRDRADIHEQMTGSRPVAPKPPKVAQGRDRADTHGQMAGRRAVAPKPPEMPRWRQQLLRKVRQVTGNPEIVFPEQLPLGAIFEPVSAGPETAAKLDVPRGSIIGYVVREGHVKGGAIGDLGDVQRVAPPYPDPFVSRSEAMLSEQAMRAGDKPTDRGPNATSDVKSRAKKGDTHAIDAGLNDNSARVTDDPQPQRRAFATANPTKRAKPSSVMKRTANAEAREIGMVWAHKLARALGGLDIPENLVAATHEANQTMLVFERMAIAATKEGRRVDVSAEASMKEGSRVGHKLRYRISMEIDEEVFDTKGERVIGEDGVPAVRRVMSEVLDGTLALQTREAVPTGPANPFNKSFRP